MAIILIEIKQCYKMGIFHSSSVSCLTYYVATNLMKVWQFNLPGFFSRFSNSIFSRLFKKNDEKNSKFVKILARF